VIAPNEDAGKDYVRGFKAGLGEHIDQLVSETTYLTADPTIDSQMVTMRESGADVFFAEATPKFAAQAIKKAASMGWKPLIILPTVSNSFAAVLEPAGLENSVGVVTGLYLKDPNDARWADDAALKDWLAWMKKYSPMPAPVISSMCRAIPPRKPWPGYWKIAKMISAARTS